MLPVYRASNTKTPSVKEELVNTLPDEKEPMIVQINGSSSGLRCVVLQKYDHSCKTVAKQIEEVAVL